MTREMPLVSSLIQGDHEIGIALQEIDRSVSTSVNAIQIDYVLHLLEAATEGPCASIRAETPWPGADRSSVFAHHVEYDECSGILTGMSMSPRLQMLLSTAQWP